MTTDKTGAQTTVSAANGKYTIAVDGETVGLAAVADHDNQRVFYHTEVDERFGGRGLANILVGKLSRRPVRMANASSPSARWLPRSSKSTRSSATSLTRSLRRSCGGRIPSRRNSRRALSA